MTNELPYFYDTQPLGPVSDIEVHPCIDDGEDTYQCDPEEAHFWSVYVRYNPNQNDKSFGGVDCIADL